MEALTVQVRCDLNGWSWHVVRPGGAVVECGDSYSRVGAIQAGWEAAVWHERHTAAMITGVCSRPAVAFGPDEKW